MACQFCNRDISNKGSLKAHEMACKQNPEKIIHNRSSDSGRKKGKEYFVWNKGKTKDTDNRLLEKGKSFSKKYAAGEIQHHYTPHTESTKQRLSSVAKERKLGGYIQGSGRGKKGWYKGFFCDSSWELAYVVYCLEHSIDIKRNTKKRQYTWQGEVKNYIPDFIVKGTITEIKGYKTKQWVAKLEANPDVTVLYEKDLEPIFAYVISKYGKDFISLYE
jgi:hypothetical protein